MGNCFASCAAAPMRTLEAERMWYFPSRANFTLAAGQAEGLWLREDSSARASSYGDRELNRGIRIVIENLEILEAIVKNGGGFAPNRELGEGFGLPG